MLYFIQGVPDLPIKIGVAGDPVTRRVALQACSPVLLELLGVCEGNYATERNLHEHFQEQRLHGEWFDAAIKSEVEEFIRDGVPVALQRGSVCAACGHLIIGDEFVKSGPTGAVYHFLGRCPLEYLDEALEGP